MIIMRMIKWSIHQEYVIIINIHISNIGETKYIKQIPVDLKREINNTIIGYFSTLL